ncbi:MAG TPA: glycosyltransferase family 4 protein [Anaerolineae bacterium]|nr:glycosyltransferase family 4 protein [Anaerolineae bacterium]
MNDWFVPIYTERVQELAQAWQPDIVQIEFHIMAQYLAALNDCPAPRVLVEHEPGVPAARERHEFRQTQGYLLPRLDLLAWRHYERAILRTVNAVVVFTERDRQAIDALTAKPIVTIPLGIDIPTRALNPEGCPPLNLLFIGNFKHPPNVDAAMHLASTIFPQVQARYPELQLYLVGDTPPLTLYKLKNKQIVVTGRVPEVRPYLDRASVVVIPLRHGGGMRVKVLEALAAGKAIVATARAVEGLNVKNGEQVILAEQDAEFCEAIVRLLAAPNERVQLAQRGRAWASTQLNWDKSVRAYEMLYEQLLQGTRDGANKQ